MSSMDTMLAGVLKKALPPEVLELLTPEKIKEISDGINAYIVNTRDSLERIEAQNYAILTAIEDLNNDGHSASGSSGRAKRRTDSSSGGATGSGDGAGSGDG